eukprot:s914_g19.t7
MGVEKLPYDHFGRPPKPEQSAKSSSLRMCRRIQAVLALQIRALASKVHDWSHREADEEMLVQEENPARWLELARALHRLSRSTRRSFTWRRHPCDACLRRKICQRWDGSSFSPCSDLWRRSCHASFAWIGGLTGSGKSTICRVLRHLLAGVWINRDEFGSRTAFLKAIAEAAADDAVPVLLVDEMQHQTGIVQEMQKDVQVTSSMCRSSIQMRRWIVGKTLSWCASRIARRGSGHRTLMADHLQLRSKLQRKTQDAEPLSKEEVRNFAATLCVSMAQTSIAQVTILLQDLDELGLLEPLEPRCELASLQKHRLLQAQHAANLAESQLAEAAPAAETSRQSAFAFDDEATAPAAAETARQSPLTFEDDGDEEEVPAAATEPARQAPLAFEDEEEVSSRDKFVTPNETPFFCATLTPAVMWNASSPGDAQAQLFLALQRVPHLVEMATPPPSLLTGRHGRKLSCSQQGLLPIALAEPSKVMDVAHTSPRNGSQDLHVAETWKVEVPSPRSLARVVQVFSESRALVYDFAPMSEDGRRQVKSWLRPMVERHEDLGMKVKTFGFKADRHVSLLKTKPPPEELLVAPVPPFQEGGSVARGRLGCPGCFPSQPAGSPGLGEGVRHGETPRFPEAGLKFLIHSAEATAAENAKRLLVTTWLLAWLCIAVHCCRMRGGSLQAVRTQVDME